MMDIKRGFCDSCKTLGLKQKAIEEGIEVTITGDGETITTSVNNVQCCVGLKFIDIGTKDPMTGQQCFFRSNEDACYIQPRVFANSQTTNICMPVGICLQ